MYTKQTSTLVVGAACATIVLMLGVGCGGEADPPSGALETTVAPALEGAPTDYVVTPGGLIHKSCIHEVPSGGAIDENDDITLDGRKLGHLGRCEHPRRSVTSPTPGLTPYINDWVEIAAATAPLNVYGFNWINEITATMVVPAAPPSAPAGNLFLWPGLEPGPYSPPAVIQPVLTYGVSDAGGGNYWSVGLWYINQFGSEVHTGLLRVSKGDVLVGTVKLDCTTAGTSCNALVSMARNGTVVSSLSLHTTELWQSAVKGALEAHGVSTCNQFPAAPDTAFTNTHVYMPGPTTRTLNDVTTTLSWFSQVNSVTPNCSFSVTQPNPYTAILFY